MTLETVYAEHTVPHMLSGKAIARAIRGHLIVVGVLRSIMIEDINKCSITIEDDNGQHSTFFQLNENPTLKQISKLLEESISGKTSIDELRNAEVIMKMFDTIQEYEEECLKSRTAKLWLQYIDMVTILCKFIKAERVGNYQLHLEALHEMLPFFAASGHHLYLKSAYIYLQMMSKLPTTHPSVYQKFMQGYHVVRRSDRFLGGLSTDLIIEQVIEKSVVFILVSWLYFQELYLNIHLNNFSVLSEINKIYLHYIIFFLINMNASLTSLLVLSIFHLIFF